MPFEECARSECIASLHGFDLSRVMTLAGKEEMPEIIVIGVEPAVIEWSMELSPTVKASLPLVLKAVREEIENTEGYRAACCPSVESLSHPLRLIPTIRARSKEYHPSHQPSGTDNYINAY